MKISVDGSWSDLDLIKLLNDLVRFLDTKKKGSGSLHLLITTCLGGDTSALSVFIS